MKPTMLTLCLKKPLSFGDFYWKQFGGKLFCVKEQFKVNRKNLALIML